MRWNHMLAHFLLSGGEKKTEEELLAFYDVPNVDEIERIQNQKLLELPQMLSLYQHVELQVVEIADSMAKYGINIDKEKLKSLRTDYEAKRSKLVEKITAKLGPVNLNSPKQLGQALVLEHKLTLPKTKTGQYATTSEILGKYAPTHEVVREILEFRALDKILNTYILPILDRLDEGSRIHPSYDLMSAATGRLASSNPNIQSTPVVGVYGDAIRSVFVAPQGSKLISFDYSQQELRILAHLSGDESLHAAFQNGLDVHILTASKVLGINLDKVSKADRTIGKTLNFGILYGESSYGLSRQLGKKPEECAEILKKYFETYHGVKRYFDNLLIHAKMHGYIETILGRRRGVPGQKIYVPKKMLLSSEERVLKNFPIQGSAADMTKKAMVDIWQNVMPKYPQAHMVMQIHDELVFEYNTSVILGQRSKDLGAEILPSSGRMTSTDTSLDLFIVDVKSAMERAIPLSVPVVVDAKVGENWGEI